MQGDRVYLNSSATEKDGNFVFESEIGQKPLFMLDEEYAQQIIGCAIESVRRACMAIYPDDKAMRSNVAQAIAIKAVED